MSSESGKSLSLEELRQRNMPPPAPPTSPPLEYHLTAKEWASLWEMLSVIYKVTEAQYKILSQETHPLQPQIAELTKDIAETRDMIQTIQQRLQQDGKKKGKRFSFPQISLPQPSWAWLMIPMILAALAALWYGSVTILRALGM